MGKIFRGFFVGIFIITFFLVNGCGCYSCSTYASTLQKIKSDDEFVFYEYSAYLGWFEGQSCEECRIEKMEFWLGNNIMNYFPEQRLGKRPAIPPYDIVSRKYIKRDEIVYIIRVKVSDILDSIEKAK